MRRGAHARAEREHLTTRDESISRLAEPSISRTLQCSISRVRRALYLLFVGRARRMTQDTSKRYASKSTACRCISSKRSFVYHPSENEYISLSGEYIIKPQERCTLERFELYSYVAQDCFASLGLCPHARLRRAATEQAARASW